MGFKKIKYNSGESIVNIKIQEIDGSILERWTVMMSDLGNWFRLMKRKYGNRVDEKEKDKDLNWIK